jgi:hypothetical protein
MPLVLNGDGTIGGLSVGGLPDGSINADDLASSAVTEAKLASNAVTAAKIADATITPAKLNGAQSGSAPIYGARAWVNFNGTGAVAIRSSGNVTSITDGGTGTYVVNITTAMQDANYSACAVARETNANNNAAIVSIGTNGASNASVDFTTSAFYVSVATRAGSDVDSDLVCVSVFR